MKIYNFEQGSPEWFEIRRLKMTASHATEVGNAGKGLETYINYLILQEIVPDGPGYISKDMQRGNDLEDIARTKYEFEWGVDVQQVGFIEHDKYSGCSPDGLVGEEGMVEIKARNDRKHFDLLRTGVIDSATRWQMQFQLFVSKRLWVDFISYNPNFDQSLYVQRVFVDEKRYEAIKHGLYVGKKLIKNLLTDPVVIKEMKAHERNKGSN